MDPFSNVSSGFGNELKNAAIDKKIETHEFAKLRAKAETNEDKQILHLLAKDSSNISFQVKEGSANVNYDLELNIRQRPTSSEKASDILSAISNIDKTIKEEPVKKENSFISALAIGIVSGSNNSSRVVSSEPRTRARRESSESSPSTEQNYHINNTQEIINNLRNDKPKQSTAPVVEKTAKPANNDFISSLAIQVSKKANTSSDKNELPSVTPTSGKALFNEVIKKYPNLAVLEGVLRIEDYNNPVIKQHVADLALYPESVLKKVKDSGIREIHIAARTVPDLDSNQHLKGVHPRNWPEGKTWDEVAGIFSTKNLSVSAGLGETGGASLIIHETAHSLGELLHFNDAQELSDSHKRLYDKLNPYLKGDTSEGPGNDAGREELLAEGVAVLLKNGEAEAVTKFDQGFVDFLKDKVLK